MAVHLTLGGDVYKRLVAILVVTGTAVAGASYALSSALTPTISAASSQTTPTGEPTAGTSSAATPAPQVSESGTGADAIADRNAANPKRLHSNSPADLRIADLIRDRIQPNAFGSSYSIAVSDAASGELIYDAGADTARLPASTMKLLTAFNALNAFGPHARFNTRVIALRPGHIALVGAGDPTLTAANLATLATNARPALASQGLLSPGCSVPVRPKVPCSKPSVRVHYIDSLFGPHSPAPGWAPGYVPSVASPVVSLSLLGDYTATPSANAARSFAQALTTPKLRATVDAKPATDTGRTIATHAGATMAEHVTVMLQHSENNIAEVLFRQVAIHDGAQPTWSGAAAVAAARITQAGLPTAGMILRDGSGLSRKNRLTATLLNAVLARFVDRSGKSGKAEDQNLPSVYYGPGLPTGGKTGSLAGRYRVGKAKCAAGIVRAKTGALHDVISLSGVTVGADRRVKVFSILINNRSHDISEANIRRAVDKIAATVTGCW